MYDMDVEKLNKALVKSVRLCVALRQHFGQAAVDRADFMDLEREIREAAGECQRVLKLVKADAERTLLEGVSG